MSKTVKKTKVSVEAIACKAEKGEDISEFFTNKGKMMPAIQRVNVDFTLPMLSELDEAAQKLNVSRQAVIKLLLRQSLDRHYLAMQAKKKST